MQKVLQAAPDWARAQAASALKNSRFFEKAVAKATLNLWWFVYIIFCGQVGYTPPSSLPQAPANGCPAAISTTTSRRTLPPFAFRAIFTSVMPVDRYFLDRNGAVTRRARGLPGEGHHDIAKEYLPTVGIVPKDYEDHYTQMFRLKFARVLEHDDGRVEVEHKHKLTTAQKRYIQSLAYAGKRIVRVSVKR